MMPPQWLKTNSLELSSAQRTSSKACALGIRLARARAPSRREADPCRASPFALAEGARRARGRRAAPASSAPRGSWTNATQCAISSGVGRPRERRAGRAPRSSRRRRLRASQDLGERAARERERPAVDDAPVEERERLRDGPLEVASGRSPRRRRRGSRTLAQERARTCVEVDATRARAASPRARRGDERVEQLLGAERRQRESATRAWRPRPLRASPPPAGAERAGRPRWPRSSAEEPRTS